MTTVGQQSSENPATDSSSRDGVLRPVSPVSRAGVLARLLVLVVAAPLLLLGVRATLVLALAAVALLSRRHRHWQRAGVPQRRPLPLVGNMGPLLLHATSPAHLLADLHLRPPAGCQDCPLVGFYIFDRPALLVRDPDLVRQLLVKDFADFPDRHTEAAPADALGSLNMFGARAALWRRLRASTSPAFTGARMRAMLPQVDRSACAMVERLLEKGAGGSRPVKVRDVASRCVTDILTSCLFGVEGGALSGEQWGWCGAVRRVFGFAPRRALEVLAVFVAPQLPPLRLLAPRFFGAAAERFFRDAFAQLAQHRRLAAAGGKPAHVFDMLMALASKEGGLELCTAQASILVTAGSETTATALTCCLYELAANPHLQEHLRREVRQRLKPHASYQEIAAMTYLHMVVAETLRKYPALPYVERRCRRPCSLGACADGAAGVPLELEAGTPVFVSTLGLHHDPRFFPQPERFDPERFSEDACRARHPYCYAPFGHGPRSCVASSSHMTSVRDINGRQQMLCGNVVRPLPWAPPSKVGMEAAGMTSVWLPAATLAALLCWWLVRRSHSYWQRRGVACPLQPHPLLGHLQNLALLKESARDLLHRVYHAGHGIPYVGMYFMHKPALMVRDPELVQRVLVSEFASFPDRYARTGQHRDPLGHANLFLMRSPRWRALRSKLSPAFTSGHLRRMAHIVDRCADQLLGLLDGALDVRETMARFTTDVISNCAFGVNSNAMGDPESPFRAFGRKIFEFTRARGAEVYGIFYAPWLSDILGFSFFQSETSEFLRNSLWQVIRGREQSGEKRSDFVDLLIQLKNKGIISPAGEEKDGGDVQAKDKGLFDFEGDDLVAQASVFFSAGFETTGSALAFTLYELAHNPDIQERLRAEILEALAKAPQGPLTYDSVADIRYLNMCIAETLRKYPPVPQLDRECVRTCDSLVPGLRIEKGTPIVVPVMAMHYDPELFPEPDRYDPERFAPEVVGKGPKGYLPFGDGPRICIGTRFAQMVLRLALVKILSSGLQVVPAEDTPAPPLRFNKYSFMTGTVGGIPLRFRRVAVAA